MVFELLVVRLILGSENIEQPWHLAIVLVTTSILTNFKDTWRVGHLLDEGVCRGKTISTLT